MQYTADMYQYLVWRLFQKMYGAIEWYEKEGKQIDELADRAGRGLSDEERKIVENRVIRMSNEYEKWALEGLQREYWHEFNDDGDDDFFFAPIDFDEKLYEIWKQGVAKRQTVKMKYDSTTSGMTERLVDPYKSRAPYGEGYCHSRKEVRKFRFDRVINIELTDRNFEKPKETNSDKPSSPIISQAEFITKETKKRLNNGKMR